MKSLAWVEVACSNKLRRSCVNAIARECAAAELAFDLDPGTASGGK
ncbi:MAG: hypothetical protein LBL67_03850 [Coriobacteriales bacterium]|nr:hypothetical protein [Coriobacteriales bacterium]